MKISNPFIVNLLKKPIKPKLFMTIMFQTYMMVIMLKYPISGLKLLLNKVLKIFKILMFSLNGQYIVALVVHMQDSNHISLGRMVDIIVHRQRDRCQAKEKYGTDVWTGFPRAREGAEQKVTFI